MRGRAALKRDREADGGFMEALLAMMVVTVAVALLALSFSLTAHDLREAEDVTSLEQAAADIMHQFREDRSIWRDGALVWASLEVRAAEPYQILNGTQGYTILIMDLEYEGLKMTIGPSGTQGAGARAVEQHAWNLLRPDGTVGPGLIILEVW